MSYIDSNPACKGESIEAIDQLSNFEIYCGNCNLGSESTTLRGCSGCGKTNTEKIMYCSEQCQKEHWIRGHNKVCPGSKKASESSKDKSTSSTTSSIPFVRPRLYTPYPNPYLLRQLSYLERRPGVGYVIFLEEGGVIEVRLDREGVKSRQAIFTGNNSQMMTQEGIKSLPPGPEPKRAMDSFGLTMIINQSHPMEERIPDFRKRWQVVSRQLNREFDCGLDFKISVGGREYDFN